MEEGVIPPACVPHGGIRFGKGQEKEQDEE